MWKGSHCDLQTLDDIYRSLDPTSLPVHQVGWAEIPGRSGYLAVQGAPVPDSSTAST
jgi:hypothetical protein